MSATIEHIEAGGVIYGVIVRASHRPDKTTFVTEPWSNQQVGHVVYPKGGVVPRHYHKQIDRHLTGTGEVLLIQKGRCAVIFYDFNQMPVTTRTLETGDLLLIYAQAGQGHGFEMFEDTVMLEVKQGPYTGDDEKVRF